MSACELSRRAALAAIGALMASQGAAIRSALARPGSFSGVRVDVSPLLEPAASQSSLVKEYLATAPACATNVRSLRTALYIGGATPFAPTTTKPETRAPSKSRSAATKTGCAFRWIVNTDSV